MITRCAEFFTMLLFRMNFCRQMNCTRNQDDDSDLESEVDHNTVKTSTAPSLPKDDQRENVIEPTKITAIVPLRFVVVKTCNFCQDPRNLEEKLDAIIKRYNVTIHGKTIESWKRTTLANMESSCPHSQKEVLNRLEQKYVKELEKQVRLANPPIVATPSIVATQPIVADPSIKADSPRVNLLRRSFSPFRRQSIRQYVRKYFNQHPRARLSPIVEGFEGNLLGQCDTTLATTDAQPPEGTPGTPQSTTKLPQPGSPDSGLELSMLFAVEESDESDEYFTAPSSLEEEKKSSVKTLVSQLENRATTTACSSTNITKPKIETNVSIEVIKGALQETAKLVVEKKRISLLENLPEIVEEHSEKIAELERRLSKLDEKRASVSSLNSVV